MKFRAENDGHSPPPLNSPFKMEFLKVRSIFPWIGQGYLSANGLLWLLLEGLCRSDTSVTGKYLWTSDNPEGQRSALDDRPISNPSWTIF